VDLVVAPGDDLEQSLARLEELAFLAAQRQLLGLLVGRRRGARGGFR
jgi:hypothetical protein